MGHPDTLSAAFGPVTVTISARDCIREMALRALSADAPTPPAEVPAGDFPAIGEYSAAHGGIYCGRLVDDEDRVYALVVARKSDGEIGRAEWAQALEKCKALRIGDFTDWSAPNCMESLAMWQRLCPVLKGTDDAFAEEAYWTSEQISSYDAWHQYFYDGGQYTWSKDGYYRARAVRRVYLAI